MTSFILLFQKVYLLKHFFISLNREAIPATDDYLKIGERRNLTVLFYYPKEAGNDTGDSSLSFVLSAEAVQMLNNPGRIFG